MNGGVSLEFLNPIENSHNVSTDLLNNIEHEWQKFMEGLAVDKNIIPEYVLESWQRCKLMGVDALCDGAYMPNKLSDADIDEKLSYFINANERLNNCIKEIKNQLSDLNMFVNYSTKTDDGKLITTNDNNKLYFYDASEKTMGTTSISLASSTGKLIFLVGPMHYKHAYHDLYCFSKPVLDGQNLVGVLTITWRELDKYKEVYAFLTSIYNILDKEYAIIKNEKKLNKPSKKNNQLYATFTFEDIIGQSYEIIKLKKLALKISQNNLPVLISGESGTGKELLAQAIHNSSKRCDEPFVAINCGAISKELVESELFGYEPGAFTGALRSGKKGKLEAASNGTIFLDEIDSMPLDVQIKLLRAISSNEIVKIGGVNPIPIDIRIISATKENLLEKADAGSFREDLYYRIAYFNLDIPPLRERIKDIPLLVACFVEKYEKENECQIKVGDDYIEHLLNYYWRGNIRELQNAVYTSIALLCDNNELISDLLPDKILKSYDFNKNKALFNEVHEKVLNPFTLKHELEIYEEIIIKNALEQENGNITRTAKNLDIAIKSLYRKIDKYPKLKKYKSK